MQRTNRITRTLLFVFVTALATSANAQSAPQHYQDAENGVSFDYIAPWHLVDADKDTEYLRPSIQPVRAAVFLNKADAGYDGTDFSGLSFNYAIAPAKTAAACTAAITANADAAPGPIVTVNGRKFASAEGGDAAMNHQISERLYSTFANNRCYVFDLELSTAGFGVDDDIRQMFQVERDDAQKKLDAIFGTLHIANLGH